MKANFVKISSQITERHHELLFFFPGAFLRRRLIPAPLPDASSLGRKWLDLPPLGSAVKEPFEIKVYEIDDMEHLQRVKEVGSEVRRCSQIDSCVTSDLLLDAASDMMKRRKTSDEVSCCRSKLSQTGLFSI